MLNLNSIMLNSEAPATLIKFYGEVLQKKPDWADDKSGFSGYLAGACFLTIGPHSEVKGKSQNPERVIMFFATTEVEAEFKRIKSIAGVEVVKEPYNPGEDGNTMLATFADPDGNYFQLNTPFDM
jgi:predicted enzyme related to lactoylglutathione lyase